MDRKGFSLVELLIVIAIIGILVSAAAVSYSSAQRKGRDSRRHGDVKAIQQAWEQYYADNNGNYPATCTVSTTYLPAGLPTDPKTGGAYQSVCSASQYCFCANLEGEENSDIDCAGVVAASPYIGLDCVRQLQ